MKYLSRRNFLKYASVAAVGASSVAVLGGCGSSSSASEEETSQSLSDVANVGSSTESDENQVDAETSAADAEETVIRDLIVLGVQSDPTDWAPYAAAQNGRTTALTNCGIYQGFYWRSGSNYYNSLAKNYTISDDGLTVDFEMFDYITDHNGNPVNAYDAVFSWDLGVGLGYTTGVSFVDSAEAVDDYTVRFNLNRIMGISEFDSICGFAIVSQESYENAEQGMSTWAIGTGPYMLTEYTSNYSFTYSMNEDYWQTDKNYVFANEFQNVRDVQYYIIAESTQRTIALETGTIDMCAEISSDDIGEFMEGGEYNDEYWTYGVYDNLCLYCYPNCNEGKVTADVNLRQAMFYAINSEAVVESVYNGLAVTCWDFGSRWVIGYDEAWENEDGYYQYDVDKAKEYLEASSYDGSELVILTEGTSDTSNTATLIQSFLLAIGINSRIEAVESSILNTYRENPDNWDILVMKYACSTYTANGYMMSFSKDRYSWGGTINFVYDDDFQDMVALNLTTAATQDDMQTMHEYIMEQAYGYNICNFVTNYVLNRCVTSVALTSAWAIVPGGCTYEAD